MRRLDSYFVRLILTAVVAGWLHPAFAATPAGGAPASQWQPPSGPYSWDSGSYVYDGAGNVAAIGIDTYAYDGARRLASSITNARGVATTQTFVYDRYGNINQITSTVARPGQSSTTSTLAIGVTAATNRVTQSCVGTACASWHYDLAGNQDSMTASANQYGYQWDAVGSMTSLHTNAIDERYVYDANDERIAVVSMAGSAEVVRRWTLRDAGNKVSRAAVQNVATDTWSALQDYVYRGGTLLAAFDAAEQTVPNRHYSVDHLGSPRVITDSTRKKLAVDFYLPFGGEAPGQERHYAGFEERVRFTGHERDGAGNPLRPTLDYMHARYYYAEGGRFLSLDPVVDKKVAVQRPQMWNRYSYVADNPLGNIDPDGRWLVMFGGSQKEREKARDLLLSDLPKKERKYVTMDSAGLLHVAANAKGGDALAKLKRMANDPEKGAFVILAEYMIGKDPQNLTKNLFQPLQPRGAVTAPPGLSLTGEFEIWVDPHGSQSNGASAMELMAHELWGHTYGDMYQGGSTEQGAQLAAAQVLMEQGIRAVGNWLDFPK